MIGNSIKVSLIFSLIIIARIFFFLIEFRTTFSLSKASVGLSRRTVVVNGACISVEKCWCESFLDYNPKASGYRRGYIQFGAQDVDARSSGSKLSTFLNSYRCSYPI